VKLAISDRVPSARERVFAALIDPAILRQSIPGCESLTAAGPDTYEATLKIGVPGLKGTYAGRAAVQQKHPPDAITLTFEGKGSPGFVRGSAAITLSEGSGPSVTAVACEADVQVGGLIAAVGSRLVEAAARKLAADFFHQLSTALQQADYT
jgi:carbon monoxide dehydrogenase subunit G